MSTSSRHLAGLALACAAAFGASVHAEENIDAFARAHLKASQEAQEGKAAAERSKSDSAVDAAAKSARVDSPPELLFIQGVDNTTVAYLRVDGRFGHTVKRGDSVGEWNVVAIGDDFVDVKRHGKPTRLLLPDTVAAEHTAQGRRDGNVR